MKTKRTPAQKLSRLTGILLDTQVDSAKHMQRIVRGEHPDASTPWGDASSQTRAAALFAQASMAAERAKTVSEAPRAFGVVLVAGRLPDTTTGRLAWEADAAKLKEQRSIEAVATAKEPNGGT